MKTSKKVWGSDFIKLAQQKKYLIKKPTSTQFEAYVNFILSGKNADGNPTEVKLSLKPFKGNKLSKWLWIELKNSKGKPGWLYGESDFIVFELESSYLFVVRKNLLEYIHSSIDFHLPLVQNTWEAKYKIFQRPGKLDQITQIKLQSIKNLKGNYSWEKL